MGNKFHPIIKFSKDNINYEIIFDGKTIDFWKNEKHDWTLIITCSCSRDIEIYEHIERYQQIPREKLLFLNRKLIPMMLIYNEQQANKKVVKHFLNHNPTHEP